MAAHFLEILGGADGDRTPHPPEGATPGKIAIDLHTVRLRDFALVKNGVPTLLCTPLALHGAALADLAAGHSLVADRKSTRLNSSHIQKSRMPSSA